MNGLTARQREVLAVMAEGCTQAEAGDRLGISRDAVHKTLECIYAKLGIEPTGRPYGGLLRAIVLNRDWLWP